MSNYAAKKELEHATGVDTSDLDAWPRNPTNNFKFRNCLFGATSVLKNSYKEKFVYSGYGINLIVFNNI